MEQHEDGDNSKKVKAESDSSSKDTLLQRDTTLEPMSAEDNKAIVGRWFTEFWGPDYNPDVVDELAAPNIRFEYSLHAPLSGRDAVRDFATKFRAAFPDLAFAGTADLIAEGDYVVV